LDEKPVRLLDLTYTIPSTESWFYKSVLGTMMQGVYDIKIR